MAALAPRKSKTDNYVPALKVSPESLVSGKPAPAEPFRSALLDRLERHQVEAPVLARLKEMSQHVDNEKAASINIRKACNSLKMMASIVSAIVFRPGRKAETQEAVQSAGELVAVSQKMCDRVLNKLSQGEPSTFPIWVQRTILLTTTDLVKDAWIAEVELDDAFIDSRAELLCAVATSDVPFLESEFRQPAGDLEPVRLTLTNALAPVIAEIEIFNFFRKPDELAMQAASMILETAQEAAKRLTPADAAEGSRVMLLQNLITNAAKLYRASYQAYATEILDNFNELPRLERRAAIAKAASEGVDLKPIHDAFLQNFGRLVNVTERMMEQLAPAPAAPRKGAAP